MTEPAPRPPVDVRVGSSTDGLAPVSVAERSLAAGTHEWVGLAAVSGAAVVADQITKRIVAGTLELGESRHVAGPLDLHHVQNSGIAFGLFPEATTIVIVLTSMVIAWLLVVFARSGARHPVMPVGLGLVASAVVLLGKFALDSDAAMFAGVGLLVAASLWNTWPRSAAGCPACATAGR